MNEFDVIVVGAGPGGSTVARLLAHRGWRVLLVDRARFPRPKTCGDGLTPRAVRTLRHLGLEEAVARHAYRVDGARLVAPSGVTFTASFDPHVAPLPSRGYVLPRLHLDHLLLQEALEAGVTFRPGVKVVDVAREGRQVVGVVMREDGQVQTSRARLIILAVGAAIPLLHRLGLVQAPPHEVLAVRGYWRGVSGLSAALEFFFSRQIAPGYAWVFPTGEAEANIGVGIFRPAGTKDGRNAARALREFLTKTPEMASRLCGAEMVGAPQGYPIRTDFPSHPVCGPGWMVVGEAAGLVNPVTGEGIDLALESAVLAAEVASETLRREGTGKRGLWPYAWKLHRRFAHTFRGLRRLRPIVMRPRALEILIRRAERHPGLAARIMGITLGTTSPYSAFLPSTWRWLLSG